MRRSFQSNCGCSIRQSGVFTFTCDAANRLITVTNGTTLTLGYRYNGDGVLVAQTANGVGPRHRRATDADPDRDQRRQHLYGAADVLAWRDGGVWVYPLKDALDSVRQLTGKDGQVDEAAAYSPFGVPDDGGSDVPRGCTLVAILTSGGMAAWGCGHGGTSPAWAAS